MSWFTCLVGRYGCCWCRFFVVGGGGGDSAEGGVMIVVVVWLWLLHSVIYLFHLFIFISLWGRGWGGGGVGGWGSVVLC